MSPSKNPQPPPARFTNRNSLASSLLLKLRTSFARSAAVVRAAAAHALPEPPACCVPSAPPTDGPEAASVSTKLPGNRLNRLAFHAAPTASGRDIQETSQSARRQHTAASSHQARGTEREKGVVEGRDDDALQAL